MNSPAETTPAATATPLRHGRVVVITGAAGGIGRLLVDRFLSAGDTVVATDTSRDALESALGAWKESDRLITAAGDISRDQDIAELAALIGRATGRVDVLVNCAGYFPITSLEEMTHQQWRQVIDINLTGTFMVTQALLPLMKASEHGRIVTFGSGSVFDGTPGQAHYVAAKAGVAGFTRSLAREVGRYDITANVITPGLTVTPAVREHFPAQILRAQREARALHRDEEPADLVGPVFFLAFEDAAFVTGQILNVDGGAYMY